MLVNMTNTEVPPCYQKKNEMCLQNTNAPGSYALNNIAILNYLKSIYFHKWVKVTYFGPSNVLKVRIP